MISTVLPSGQTYDGGRFYLSKVVGDGTEGNPFRPKLMDYGVSFSASHVAQDAWAVCFVPDPQAKVPVDPDLHPLPAGGPDDLLGTQPSLDLAKVVDKASLGLGVAPDVSPTRTLRQLVDELGGQHDPAFDAAVLNPDWRH